MKTILHIGKGGCGKTVFATNLGVLAHQQHLKVGLVDADPQGSLTDWRHRRGSADIPVRSCRAHQLQEAIGLAKRACFDCVLIDMPPSFDANTLAIICVADFVVLPMRPTIMDFGVTRKWAQLLRSAARPFGVVINQAPPRRQGTDAPAVRDVRAALHDIRVPLWRGQITQRLSVPHSAIGGRAVAETEPTGPAACEFSNLWQAVVRNSNPLRRIDHEHSSPHAA